MTQDLAAYRAELASVARPLRLAGLMLILLGGGLLAASGPANPGLRAPGFAFLGCGWALWFYTVYVRSRWAKAHPFAGEG